MTELDFSKKVADRYLKREVLGEGTYGVVFKAIDTKVVLSLSSNFFFFLLGLRTVCAEELFGFWDFFLIFLEKWKFWVL